MARHCLIAVLALILFAWLAREVTHGDAMRLDTPIRNAVHARSSPPLTAMMRGVSLCGSEVILVPLGVILVWWLVAAKRRRAAVVFGVAALGAEALDQIMKLLFDRPRPEPFFGLASPITHSFPSGHAMVSCCFFGVLAMILAARGAPRAPSRFKRTAIFAGAALLVVLMGFSRVYLGFHYPTDVLAGYAAAVVWLAVVRAAVLASKRRICSAASFGSWLLM
ncbi:MAG: phosphatase PAP2 family protein [Bryobacteraceae bacterium]